MPTDGGPPWTIVPVSPSSDSSVHRLFRRPIALLLMLTVQLPALGMRSLDCESATSGHDVAVVEPGAAVNAERMTEHSSKHDEHAMYGGQRSLDRTVGWPDRMPAQVSHALHDCETEQDASQSQSHSTNCELMMPCGSMLFTIAAASIPILAEGHSQPADTLLGRPSSTRPAPDAPPPRA
jgi:hypothetical protein